MPQIGVFDDTFVADNVYAGYQVDHEHRRNLYRVIIGEEGIRLAGAVDDLDQEIRTADGAIREKEQALRRFIPAYLTTNDFLCLPEDQDMYGRISRSAREIESAQQAEEIGRKAELVVLSLPMIPARLHELLTKTLADIALDAEVRVREHLAQHTNAAKESWAQEGIGYILGDTCPFCAQSLQSVDLIDAYRAYFSRTYRELQANLHSLRTEIQRLTTDIPVLQLERAKETNANLAEFWRRFLAFDLPEMDVTEVGGGLRAAAVGAMRLVDQKLEKPLEAVQIGADFSAAQEGLDLARTSILAYNNAVAAANALIRQQKAAVQTARLSEL